MGQSAAIKLAILVILQPERKQPSREIKSLAKPHFDCWPVLVLAR